jgi:acid phosphatase
MLLNQLARATAAACLIASGACAAQASTPGLGQVGQIVVIYMENRSFDHLFGLYPGVHGIADAVSKGQVQQTGPDGRPYATLPPVTFETGKVDHRFTQPIANGSYRLDAVVPLSEKTGSPIHAFWTHARQINGGRNDRFVVEGNTGALPMGHIDGSSMQLWKLAQRFTMADHFFQSAYGGSFLNHMWLVCACSPRFPDAPKELVARDERGSGHHKGDEASVTTDGYAVNTMQGYALHDPTKKQVLLPPQTSATIGDRLSERGIPWAYYADGYDNAVATMKAGKKADHFSYHHQPFTYFKRFVDSPAERAAHLKDKADLMRDIQAGKLPPVAYYKPTGLKNMHPGMTRSSIQAGDEDAASVVQAIMAGPQWHNTVVIVTTDENGGFWDHMAPPKGDRFGPASRIPALVISPFSEGGHIDHTEYQTVSILKLIEERFGLAPLGERDAAANSLARALRFPAQAAGASYTGTKTPYRPQQDSASYEVPPAGYSVVYTQLLARHGSRGLTGPKSDLALYDLWLKAQAEGALTPLGAKLGPDIMALIRANALLGYGVEGVTNPGYGNLSQAGINEHIALAQRLRARHRAMFDQLAANAATAPRKLVVLSSGVDRAKDSAATFARSLVAGSPALASQLDQAGADRFMLYFHSLKKDRDTVANANDPRNQVLKDSMAYQAYTASADYQAKLGAIGDDAKGREVARAVLESLFSKDFVNRIDAGKLRSSNSGSYSFTSADGKFTGTAAGNGKEVINGLADAVGVLHDLYVIAPGLKVEGVADFGQYIAPAQASYLAYLQDREAFYKAGPSYTESDGVTYRMAGLLENDFFAEVDSIARGDLSRAAKLRFAHAETVIPFVSKLGLANVLAPLPKVQTYSYDNNPWRGELVAPMAANVQWDVFRNGEGKLLVKMLHNEKETAFKPACDGARIAPTSYYYDYSRLRACYRPQPVTLMGK